LAVTKDFRILEEDEAYTFRPLATPGTSLAAAPEKVAEGRFLNRLAESTKAAYNTTLVQHAPTCKHLQLIASQLTVSCRSDFCLPADGGRLAHASNCDSMHDSYRMLGHVGPLAQFVAIVIHCFKHF